MRCQWPWPRSLRRCRESSAGEFAAKVNFAHEDVEQGLDRGVGEFLGEARLHRCDRACTFSPDDLHHPEFEPGENRGIGFTLLLS